MSDKKHITLDIGKNEWPRVKDVLSKDHESHKSFAKFEVHEDILGDIPERVQEHVHGQKKGFPKIGVGRP